jgi:PAS domain S-box-containing protein
MKPQAPPYLAFVKAFTFGLKQIRLYSEQHPITQQALTTLSEELTKYFSANAKITLGSMRNMLVVDGQITGDKESSTKDLAKEFDRLGIEGISIDKAITMEEMISFLKLVALRSKSLDEQGGFKKAMETNPLPNIKLTSGKYELIEEGQKVTSEDAEVGGGPGSGEGVPAAGGGGGKKKIASMADIISRLREEPAAAGGPVAQAEGFDCQQVLTQLEKSPHEMAEAALEEAKDAATLEVVIRKVVQFLIDGLITYLVEQGKDITKALDKLAKELGKSLSRIGEGEEVDKLKKKIPRIFEEAADDLRVQMMVKTYKNNPEDPKALQKMAEKIFKDEDIRGRLGPALREDLSHAGLVPGKLDEIFDKMDEKASKKKSRVTIDAEELAQLRQKAEGSEKGGHGSAKGTVAVDAKELEELRRKAERFDEEIQGVVKKYEREKKVILDEKERVDTVIRNLAEGLLVVDKNGKVVLMNPAAERLLGVKQSEKVGKSVTEGLSEEQIVAMTSGGSLRDSEGEVTKQVEVVSLNDETKRVLQASTAVIENEDGQTVGMVSVLSDVTKQKQFEELKTKFVANVSHELRTPLVAIQKSLSVVLGKELGDVTPEQQKFLDIAHRNIDRLSRLINDLLDISKIEAGGMNLNPKRGRIQDIVNPVVATLETWSKDKGIHIKTDYSHNDIFLEADSDRLTQVLTNLMGNAIKFTPDKGTITVDAKLFKHPETSEDWVEVGVRDTGIGIAPEDQAKIFNKFVQVSLMQPAGISSTGLGLTIAKEIVELHSGKIWVESEPGKGSRFAFQVPVKFRVQEERILTD